MSGVAQNARAQAPKRAKETSATTTVRPLRPTAVSRSRRGRTRLGFRGAFNIVRGVGELPIRRGNHEE